MFDTGLVGYTATQNGYAAALDVDGGFAYVGDLGPGTSLQIFDISDPTNPIIRGAYASAGSQEIDDVDIVGDYAYISNDANGLVKVDISDPDNPTFVSSRRDGSYSNSFDYSDGQYGYATYGYTGGAEFKVYDLDNFPTVPPVNYDAAGSRHASAVHIVGDRAYFTTGNGGPAYFEIVDISDPLVPVFVSKLAIGDAQATYGTYPGEMQVIGDYAFLATGEHPPNGADGGLLVLDISDETAPSVAAFEPIPDAGEIGLPGGGIGQGLEVVGDRVYMASKTGLYVFDVSNPADPVMLIDPNVDTQFALPTDFDASLGGWVDVEGDYAYLTSVKDVANGGTQGGLSVYELLGRLNCELFFDKGQEGYAGNVHFDSGAGGDLQVTVSGEGDWILKSSNMHVGDDDLSGFPTNKNGNPKVGKFDYKEHADNGDVVFDLMLADLAAADTDNDGVVAIAVQAKLDNFEVNEEPVHEDAWATYDGNDVGFPGGSSATVMYINLDEFGLIA
jgi:hypothetical protein